MSEYPTESSQVEAETLPGSPTLVRYGVLVALALASTSAYLTRYCLAVANTTIQGEMSLTSEQMGWVFGVFNIGYFVFQVPGGWLGSRFGTRTAFPAISIIWSGITIWTAGVLSYWPLLISRSVFGCAQAGLVPLTATVINDWMPENRRGMSSAVIGASMSVGGVIALSLTSYLMNYLDWRAIFRLYSLVGIVWGIGYYFLVRSKPDEHPWVNAAEAKLILGADQAKSDDEKEANASEPASNTDSRHSDGLCVSQPAWQQMLLSSGLWGICIQSFFRAAGYGFFVTWFPAFLEKGFKVSPEWAGWYASVPLVSVIFGTMLGGVIVDLLLTITGSKWISRTLVASVALLFCGLFTLSAAWTSSPEQLVIVTAIGAIFSGLGNPTAWAATMDIAGKYTAMIVGVMNMAGTIGSFILPIGLGYLIGDIERTEGDWNVVIYLFGGIYIGGGVAWLLVNPDKKVIK